MLKSFFFFITGKTQYNAMDPNVSRYHSNSGSQFHYVTQRQPPPENHAAFYRHYVADTNIVDPFENRDVGNINMNSSNFHESVIKNYKNFDDRQSYNSAKRCVPEVSNTFDLPTNQNYGQIRANCTNLSNGSLFSSVIQSTSQYATHYQNAEYQERHNVQYIPNNMQTWDKSSNYFCKKLPDFSNVNMEVSPPSKYEYLEASI